MIGALLFSACLMHPLHETVSEVQWNAKSHRLEVAMRLHAVDAQWLMKQSLAERDSASRAKRSPETPKSSKAAKSSHSSSENWRIEYLKRKFRVETNADKNPSGKNSSNKKARRSPTYHWVGSKQDGAHTWWFFEIESIDQKMPSRIEVRMLFEMESDFVHRVLVLPPDSERAKNPNASPVALTLTTEQPTANLRPRPSDSHDPKQPTP